MTDVFPPRKSSLAASARNPPNPHGPNGPPPAAMPYSTAPSPLAQSAAPSQATPSPYSPATSSSAYSSSSKPNAAYAGWETVNERPEDRNNSQWLAQKTRNVQDESLNTTRAALGKMFQAEQIGQAASSKLYQQGEQINRIAGKVEMADTQRKIADAKAAELNALNKSIFVPTFGAQKVSAMKEGKLRQQLDSQQTRLNSADSSSAAYYSPQQQGSAQAPSSSSSGQRVGGEMESDGLDSDVEDEIDANLDLMSAGLARMKEMGMNMGSEIKKQNNDLKNLHGRVDETTDGINNVSKNISKHDGSSKGKKK
ncbi:Protein transport protein S9 plasma membrane t-SNARE [Chytriomyces hyalinus]|nr:Protein transport protein S9 plasma membrane t-SNARE [Chytriomyces hyalinus]